MVRGDLNINLDEYIKTAEKDFPFLSHQESEELVKELYNFVEEFYFLQIE
jgi:hypothetical protein